eukprot:Gregarina_sp_Poly_1__673@NODE_115_length_13858_cov_166_056486_g102_i0_p9_GENE_NODE_115_length_13858_cov_166_056486_g102_i0NODE_115_length_13858_cov_166_056486_g102_i0_p9_ORF_typecomplete_len112_score1_97W_rich_C/PF07483_11/0_02_NODE_115_length_13858_cov_166_056486_g102_i014761811
MGLIEGSVGRSCLGEQLPIVVNHGVQRNISPFTVGSSRRGLASLYGDWVPLCCCHATAVFILAWHHTTLHTHKVKLWRVDEKGKWSRRTCATRFLSTHVTHVTHVTYVTPL